MTALVEQNDQRLTAVEATTLGELEKVIGAGIATFCAVGKALAHISDRKLYKEAHATFEDYCRDRWGISRAHAYRQIEAAQVADAVSPNGRHADAEHADIPAPASERVARELAPLKDNPNDMREAWQESIEQNGSKPTARQVRAIVQRKKAPARKKSAKPSKREIEQKVGSLVLKLGALERKALRVMTALDERPDDRFGFGPHLGELRRGREALDRLIEKLEAKSRPQGNGSDVTRAAGSKSTHNPAALKASPGKGGPQENGTN
jgi:hypothetical protein